MLSLGLKRGIRKRIRKFLNRYPNQYERAKRDSRNWFYRYYKEMYEGEPSSELMDEVERFINEVLED